MKTKICIGLWVMCLMLGSSFGQSPITIYTPKNSSLTAYNNMQYMSDEVKDTLSAELARNYPNAAEIGYRSATYSYNCHGYAWHLVEGGSQVWLGYYYVTDEDVYWEDGSYIETTEPYASKISYYNGNHSAIQTATQGVYISKWGAGCLVQHANNYGPAIYQMNYRKYYKLNPGITGSTSALCYNQERTFNSDISISGATYSWSRNENMLDYVSGAGTTAYEVEAKSGAGEAWVRLQITTPSGEIAYSPYKYLWVGVPYINPASIQFQCEEGTGYLCTNAFGNQFSFDFNYPFNSFDIKLTNLSETQTLTQFTIYSTSGTLDYFPSDGTYMFHVRGTNDCGTASSWSKTSVIYEDCFSELLSLLIVPNPASEEARIKISSDIKDKIDTKSQEFSIQVYSASQILKFSKKNVFGDEIVINTSSWEKGLYIVRVMIGEKTLSGLLFIGGSL